MRRAAGLVLAIALLVPSGASADSMFIGGGKYRVHGDDIACTTTRADARGVMQTGVLMAFRVTTTTYSVKPVRIRVTVHGLTGRIGHVKRATTTLVHHVRDGLVLRGAPPLGAGVYAFAVFLPGYHGQQVTIDAGVGWSDSSVFHKPAATVGWATVCQ